MPGPLRVKSRPVRLLHSPRLLWMKLLALLTLTIYLPSAFAQSSAISGAMAPMALYINILEGEDALNNIHDRTAREPIVQVTDENHKPVKGALVTFSDVAGATGAAATFGGLVTYQAVTGADGKAVGRGFRPNAITGEHKVEVTAALGMLVALLVIIHEKNVAEAVPVFGPGAGAAGVSTSTVGFLAGFGAAVTATAVYLGLKSDTDMPTFNAATTTTTPASVPEIDPSLALGCLAMLAGALAVVRGGRAR